MPRVGGKNHQRTWHCHWCEKSVSYGMGNQSNFIWVYINPFHFVIKGGMTIPNTGSWSTLALDGDEKSGFPFPWDPYHVAWMILLMLQKSQTTTWDVLVKPCFLMGFQLPTSTGEFTGFLASTVVTSYLPRGMIPPSVPPCRLLDRVPFALCIHCTFGGKFGRPVVSNEKPSSVVGWVTFAKHHRMDLFISLCTICIYFFI